MEIHGDDEIIPKTGKKWTRFGIFGALLAREYELRRNKEVKAKDSITDNNVGKGTELKGSRLRSRKISIAKRRRSCRRRRTDFSDVDRGQSRLLIPFLQIVEKDFLREEEKREIDEQYERSKIKVNGKRVWTKKIDTAFNVIMVDPMSREWNMILGRWNMSKEGGATSNYALQVSWNSVVQDKELVTGDVIELWSFRVRGRLQLAIFTHREIFPLN
ncbi:PREDICTED: putative B3 domain-containing protein At5g35780 [Tarenaya hassleriana]|uniref:putative B3 domain-containing protein At5g35780 n=1 Tax=Tarenaya hassleriana TaxID=28532 RepID=UPI00053C3AF0|nr:PREDICTED: putative B3 domain-containing protein At5g35780 [Tarenaya hassleriana]